MTYQLTRRAVLGIYAVLVIVPLVVVIFGSFKTSQDLFASPFAPRRSWQFGNYTKIVGESGLGVAFRNSVIVTGCSVPLDALHRQPGVLRDRSHPPAGRAACSSGSSSSAWRFPPRPT